MPRISDLPAMTTPAGDDELPIVDDSASATKKITLTGLKDWLATVVGWITTAMLADNAATAEKLGTPVAFHAYRGGPNDSIVLSTWSKIDLNTEDYDLGENFDPTTNHRFVAPYDGVYNFNWRVGTANANQRIITRIYVNGTTEPIRGMDFDSVNRSSVGGGDVLLAAGDYVELYAWSDATTTIGSTGLYTTFLTGHLVGRTD